MVRARRGRVELIGRMLLVGAVLGQRPATNARRPQGTLGSRMVPDTAAKAGKPSLGV